MKLFGNNFDKLCWRIKRELHGNRKPIVLFLGNGFESQLLLLALYKLHKKFAIVHIVDGKLSQKTRNVLNRFKKQNILLFRPLKEDSHYKSFTNGNSFCAEVLTCGFSSKDYTIITGFKLSEPTLIKAYHSGTFDDLYCPFLRYPDETIQTLYQDMLDNEDIGQFLFENNTTDSHHNIEVY